MHDNILSCTANLNDTSGRLETSCTNNLKKQQLFNFCTVSETNVTLLVTQLTCKCSKNVRIQVYIHFYKA